MQKVKIKDNCFEVLRVTGNTEQFGDLKRFCGNKVHISYETSAIDNYWLITLDDDLQRKSVVIPDGFYILKIMELEHGSLFTIVSNSVINDYFENIKE